MVSRVTKDTLKSKVIRTNFLTTDGISSAVRAVTIEYNGMGHCRIFGLFSAGSVFALAKLADEDEMGDIMDAPIIGEITERMECRWLTNDELKRYGFSIAFDSQEFYWIAFNA